MPNEASERVQIPGRPFREPEEQVRLRTTCLQPGNATASRVKELTRGAERNSKRLLRFACLPKLADQHVHEPEGGDFPLDRLHVRLSASSRPR